MNASRRQILQTGLLGSLGALLSLPSARAQNPSGTRLRGVIFMVSDGMSHGVIPLAQELSLQTRKTSTRWWELLQSPKSVQGLMDMASANSLVTDSAAASSSWSSGHRILNGSINVDPKGKFLEPIGKTLREQNCRIGLVTTATVTHATPAGFAANQIKRDDESAIAPQYLDRVDIILGGGSAFFDPAVRRDKTDLFGQYAKAGYDVVRDRDSLLSSRSPKILGTFSRGHIPHSIDRQYNEELTRKVPTLAEMSRSALDRLLPGDTPFLLQIEGARIDHAAHANDIAGLLFDQLAFDDALAEVLRQIEGRNDILVVLTSDHGNSNPGLNGIGASYRQTNDHFARIASMRSSHEALFARWAAKRGTSADLVALVETHLGFRLDNDQASTLLDTLGGKPVVEWNHLLANPQGILGQFAGNHTGVGWTGTTHTADFPLITALGPGAENFHGLVRNDSVRGKILRLLLG